MTRLVFGDTNNLDKKPSQDDLFNQIKTDVDWSEGNTTAWTNKQAKFHRMRMRIKKNKNFPFKNASNLRMPTAEINIRKVKAGIMQQIFGARPIVQAVPTPGGSLEGAMLVEKFLDHLIMDVMKLESKAEIGIDQSLEKGFYLAKPHWRLEVIEREEKIDFKALSEQEKAILIQAPKDEVMLEVIRRLDIDTDPKVAEFNIKALDKAIEKVKKTKKSVDFIIKDVIYDFPDVDFLSPERVYVPTDSGVDIQKLKNITLEFFLPLCVIQDNAKNKGWDQKVVNELEAFRNVNVDDRTDIEKDQREGIERIQNPSSLVRVWETYGYYDLGSGKLKKSCITSFPDFKMTARKVLLDTYSGKYPIVKLFYELTDNRWFSHRGIPELLEDIIKEIDAQHNMKIDYQTMNNAPMMVYRAGLVNPQLARQNPAQGIPVNGTQPLADTVQFLNSHNPNAEFSYEREQLLLETKVQDMVGQVDFSLQSIINKRQPRTLGEVEQQSLQAAGVFGLDSKHFINSFSEIFEMIFELWARFGPDNYDFVYLGGSARGERLKITREEIQGKYTLKVRGNDQNTNPQVKVSKAQQILAAVTNPLLLQLGVISPQNVANGIKRFYQALDIEDWDELITNNPQPPPSDPRQAIKPNFQELTHAEQAQVLESYGVQADGLGRDREVVGKLIDQATDIVNKVG